jgi:hypothetical protein
MPLPATQGDQFIWACSSSDISFANVEWMEAILERIEERSDRTFFFQTKDPQVFEKYDFPENVMLGITLETCIDFNYEQISKAPLPSARFQRFADLDCENKKVVTIEPILNFDYQEHFLAALTIIGPERIYIGYDTKRTHLHEPRLEKVKSLIAALSKFAKVKTKLLREPWNYRANGLEAYC